ncbi:MAG: ATP-binding protein [Chlorobi bacterium NICIL-2]|nr:MAG: ATP-binding protein [Chlorobi bacterium NICIL-2]
MLINFSVKNFGPIKDKQTISFEATKSDHLEDYYVVKTKTGHRLLKIALIYGANASGKTTILQALDFLRDLVVEPKSQKTEELEYQPFLFDTDSPHQNSSMSIEFVADETRYLYEVEFNRKAVVNERLYAYNPKRSLVYERSTDLEKQLSELKFGSKYDIDATTRKNLETNTLWNNTVLGGFLKTNLDFKELKSVVNWFEAYLYPIIYPRTILERFVTSRINEGMLTKQDILSILKKADLYISDLNIKKEEQKIPEKLVELFEIMVKDRTTDDPNIKFEEKKIVKISIEFQHKVKKGIYTLPIEEESEGTKRYFALSGLLAIMIKHSVLFPIDELEASLHPELFMHFILTFLNNAKQSQLIATTHNREIFMNKDIFRNDAIWFTEKNENGATEIYSLADFDSTVIRNTSSIYNAYKSGRLGAVPNLGDIFINLDK